MKYFSILTSDFTSRPNVESVSFLSNRPTKSFIVFYTPKQPKDYLALRKIIIIYF